MAACCIGFPGARRSVFAGTAIPVSSAPLSPTMARRVMTAISFRVTPSPKSDVPAASARHFHNSQHAGPAPIEEGVTENRGPGIHVSARAPALACAPGLCACAVAASARDHAASASFGSRLPCPRRACSAASAFIAARRSASSNHMPDRSISGTDHAQLMLCAKMRHSIPISRRALPLLRCDALHNIMCKPMVHKARSGICSAKVSFSFAPRLQAPSASGHPIPAVRQTELSIGRTPPRLSRKEKRGLDHGGCLFGISDMCWYSGSLLGGMTLYP